jgi:hypothetical protein
MSGQLARLFLRGGLMNETTKRLSRDQMLRVEALAKEVFNDPSIATQKMEFCMALHRTIGNEYKDVEVGKQDAMITFWKAALLVLYHESKQCKKCKKHLVTTNQTVTKCACGGELLIKWSPKPQIATDLIKRKKFFQTVMFNYLKQILRENKPPTITEEHTEEGPAPDVAVGVITSRLGKAKIETEVEDIDDNHQVIHVETGLIPLKTLKQIHEVKEDLEEHGVQIHLDWHSISIVSALDVPPTISRKIVDKIFAKFTSWDNGGSEDDSSSHRDHCEFRVTKASTKEADFENEAIDIIRSRLSDLAQRYFDLIVNTPDDYVSRFGTDKIYKSYVAQYLGIKPEQVEDLKRNIKLNCMAMGVGVK